GEARSRIIVRWAGVICACTQRHYFRNRRRIPFLVLSSDTLRPTCFPEPTPPRRSSSARLQPAPPPPSPRLRYWKLSCHSSLFHPNNEVLSARQISVDVLR